MKIDQQKTGLEIVIRNSEGKFIATAAMKSTTYFAEVDYAKVEATNFGLKIAENARCPPLIVESNSQEEVDLVSFKKSTSVEIKSSENIIYSKRV